MLWPETEKDCQNQRIVSQTRFSSSDFAWRLAGVRLSVLLCQQVLAGGAVGPLLARVARGGALFDNWPPRTETERLSPVAFSQCGALDLIVVHLSFCSRIQI